MLLIIHNLPSNTRYTDVKTMIKDKCGITDIIVDNLVIEGKNKKVTVGLADESDAAIVIRKINGLYVCNQELYVEDVRQQKAKEQSYPQDPMSNQNKRDPYNQCFNAKFDNQFYEKQNAMQFQSLPLMPMTTQPSHPSTPNFGVPFYMTAQNQNVGNNPQFMVQYPKVQGPMGGDSYEGRDIGFNQKYEGKKRDRTMSPDHGSRRQRSPRPLSKWNESDCNRSDRRRDSDRQVQRNDRYDTNQVYKEKFYRDSFQSRSSEDYRSSKQNNNIFEKPFSRSEPNWERSDRSKFGEQNEPYRFNGNKNAQDCHYNQEREPQRFREDNYSQSRGVSNVSRSGEFSKKRSYESSDKNKFSPKNKKFGSNQQYNSRFEQEAFSRPFSNNYLNKKDTYSTKPPARVPMPQNKLHEQPKERRVQSNRPEMQTNRPQMHLSRPKIQSNRPQIQTIRPQIQPYRPQIQSNRPQMQSNKPQIQSNKPQIQSNKPQIQSNKPQIQSNRPQIQAKGIQKNTLQGQLKNQPMKNSKKQANSTKDRSDLTGIKKRTEEMLARHEAWRVQAAAVIATQIINNIGRIRNKRDPVLIKLKTYVRTRIDVITGDDMSMNLKDMLFNYREKFQDDDVFYNTVLKKVNNSEQDESETRLKVSETGEVGDKKKSDIKPKLQFTEKPPAKAPNPGDPQRLPKYPDGDKKVLSQMKQAQKDEMSNESLYSLEPEQEKILDEELDKFNGLIKQELENPGDETERSLFKFMTEVFVPDLRKILSLHVKKRILDVRTNLAVRVICLYKPPRRDILDAYLKDYGVISMKPSDKNRKVFIAICDGYENYDALCKQDSVVIDNLKVKFRPLHVTGPPIKTKSKKRQTADNEKITSIECNSGNDDILACMKENKCIEASQANVDDECENIPCKSDIDVIDENLIKSNDIIDKSDNIDNVSVNTASDEISTADTHSEVITGNDKIPTTNTIGVTENNVTVTIEDNDVAVMKDTEGMEHEDQEITGHNIADDDLEDF